MYRALNMWGCENVVSVCCVSSEVFKWLHFLFSNEVIRLWWLKCMGLISYSLLHLKQIKRGTFIIDLFFKNSHEQWK